MPWQKSRQDIQYKQRTVVFTFFNSGNQADWETDIETHAHWNILLWWMHRDFLYLHFVKTQLQKMQWLTCWKNNTVLWINVLIGNVHILYKQNIIFTFFLSLSHILSALSNCHHLKTFLLLYVSCTTSDPVSVLPSGHLCYHCFTDSRSLLNGAWWYSNNQYWSKGFL